MIQGDLFKGTTVQLTALTADDLATVALWYQNAKFLRLFDTLPAAPQTTQQLAQWLEDQHKSTDSFLFGIRLLDDDELLGLTTLDGVAWNHQVSGVSIAIGEEKNWGKGYGYEAMQLVLRFAFNELNLHRVQLTVFSYNTRGIALYERLHFQREGVHREHLQRDGKRHDMYLYGLLRHEWEKHYSRQTDDGLTGG